MVVLRSSFPSRFVSQLHNDGIFEAEDKLEFMEKTIRWKNLAPTAPTTLGCLPSLIGTLSSSRVIHMIVLLVINLLVKSK
ncbi:hypothetical protein L6452_18356 [Arctium lappa]|uniref:Uncharacterized protein n=1 Tax=Arctium lappa TaxID=4217 RepID=A0ACB9C6A5_ARCLA|nr:hypothetical protein L6452_18356 [Arctium lappa]